MSERLRRYIALPCEAVLPFLISKATWMALLAVGLTNVAAGQVQAQKVFYYHNGEKVPLDVKPSKAYVLLKPDVQRTKVENSAKAGKAVLRRFEAFVPPKQVQPLELTPDAPALRWAIIEGVNLEANVLDQVGLEGDVLYQAPFFTTPKGKEVAMSHLVYVKLKREQDRPQLEELAKENKVTVLGNNKLMPLWFTLSCSKESKGNALEVANRLHETGKFVTAEPDFMADFNIQCANDPLFGQQWGLKNTGQHGGTPGMDLGLCDAWNVSTGNPHVVVAVVDHGIELTHPDLPRISGNSFDTVTGTSPSRVRGNHGTACAGIIGAARNNNQLGVAGVAPDITLMSVSDSLTLGPDAQQNLASGLSWAWQHGAHVISNSWGHNLLASSLIDDAIHEALTNGRSGKGCVVVFAAGNDNGPLIYPSYSNPQILTVGAMSPCGERKSPSSCDPETFWGSCFGNELDVVAPGVLIPTTDRQGAQGYDSGDYALTFNGTSSATPHVAGVAALILSVAPQLTQQQVVTIIERSARKVGPYNYLTTSGRPNGGWHEEMGYGLVSAKECLDAVSSASPAPRPKGSDFTADVSDRSPRREGGEDGFRADEGYLQSLPQGPEMLPLTPEDTVARTAGFAWYNNVGVNLQTRLLGTDGTTQISVYASDVRWKYAFGNAPDVTTPGGDGGTAGGGWQFPNARRFGVTVYQGNRYWNVTSTSSGSPTVITGLSNTEPVRVTVNDTNGNLGDNSGSFDLYIRKDN